MPKHGAIVVTTKPLLCWLAKSGSILLMFENKMLENQFSWFKTTCQLLQVDVCHKLILLYPDLPLQISLVNNSPRIVGNSVFVDISVSKPTQSLMCHLRGVSGASREFSNEQNCESILTN